MKIIRLALILGVLIGFVRPAVAGETLVGVRALVGSVYLISQGEVVGEVVMILQERGYSSRNGNSLDGSYEAYVVLDDAKDLGPFHGALTAANFSPDATGAGDVAITLGTYGLLKFHTERAGDQVPNPVFGEGYGISESQGNHHWRMDATLAPALSENATGSFAGYTVTTTHPLFPNERSWLQYAIVSSATVDYS